MERGKRKRLPVLPIGLAVCVVGIAAFALLHVFSRSDNVPQADEVSATSAPEVTFAPELTPIPPPTPPVPEPKAPDISAYRPYLTGDDFITIRMDESDIHRGFLLLVNNDYRYDIPDDLDLVSIVNARTAPVYRVRSNSYRLLEPIMQPLDEMMQAFVDETGRQLMYIISAYRDYNAQQWELDNLTYASNRQTALTIASKPGHSEHHTGLAIDLATIVDGVQYSFDYFDSTKWFARNSYKYGFILRYPSGKTAITETAFEPWHYRYVGLPHSYILYQNSWVLEEYIEKIKEYTPEAPLTVNYDDVKYEIFYTDSTDIMIPAQAQYEISGNNADGFIVTIWGRYDRLTNISIE